MSVNLVDRTTASGCVWRLSWGPILIAAAVASLSLWWYRLWDAVTRHRTDGARVRLVIALPRASREADAERRLTEFAGRIVPLLTRYVPD
jgi:hypothetical protein